MVRAGWGFDCNLIVNLAPRGGAIDHVQLIANMESYLNMWSGSGDLTGKPCPRGGALDLAKSQIPTLPHLCPYRGGWGIILIGA